MLCIQTTKNGQPSGYLVIVNENYGCYTDLDGTFRRSIDDLKEELAWVEETWETKEKKEFPFEESLLKGLQYVQEYKNSIAVAKE